MLSVIALVLLAADPHPTSELLGHWRGESICVKADWNAACNDEIVFYDAVPGDKPGRVLLHAYKIVNGKNELMGDLTFAYDTSLGAWTAEFQNTRVHIRFLFDVQGSSISGRLVLLPSMRLGRNIHVTRDPR